MTETLARRAALALMATGRYDESPDSTDWLRMEAEDLACCVDLDGPTAEVVLFVVGPQGSGLLDGENAAADLAIAERIARALA